MPEIRKFETGATRNIDNGQLDFEGFLSPLVLCRFAEYMHHHRQQANGEFRASDNWQKGMPLESYMKSGWRHFIDWWMEHRGLKSRETLEEGLCALLFNVQGYLHETLKNRDYKQYPCNTTTVETLSVSGNYNSSQSTSPQPPAAE